MTIPDTIWYASYGSNLLRERFMRYILGGTAPGATFSQIGCSDHSPPQCDCKLSIPHRLYFALNFEGWENLGVAFVSKRRDPNVRTLGRMYLISSRQFKEIVVQENARSTFELLDTIDLQTTVTEGFSTIPGSHYDRLIYLGQRDGSPIFTFTANWDEGSVKLTRPGPKYLAVLSEGLREAYAMSDEAIADYFTDAEGIAGCIPREELLRIVTESGG